MAAVETVFRRGGEASSPYLLDKLYRVFYRCPEPVRFFISGNIGNIIFFILNHFLSELVEHNLHVLPAFLAEYKDGVTFMTAYFLQVVPQHWLHAALVYGFHTINTREKYLKTLLGNYSTYGGAMVGSTILNTILIKLGMNRNVAFVSTLWIFACINYFILKYLNNLVVKTSKDKKTGGRVMDKTVRGGSCGDLHSFVVSIGPPVSSRHQR